MTFRSPAAVGTCAASHASPPGSTEKVTKPVTPARSAAVTRARKADVGQPASPPQSSGRR